MRYKISYACVSDVGKRRRTNQDNFVCEKRYVENIESPPEYPLVGCPSVFDRPVIGVFDGMGGEECGEVAALIAAKRASALKIGDSPIDDLLDYCKRANEEICRYITDNKLRSMGTTAAMLVFTEKEISLCNIGDSKIFRFADRELEQISKDHYFPVNNGRKPPLSQNLGIPPSELSIRPHVAKGEYQSGDIYLLCSDGLTDMVTNDDIAGILSKNKPNDAAKLLVNKALDNGGRDNVTVIVCRVEHELSGFGKMITDLFCKEK